MIKVVTDSVASLPKDIVEDENIEVVSLYLNENGHEHVDATMDLDDFRQPSHFKPALSKRVGGIVRIFRQSGP